MSAEWEYVYSELVSENKAVAICVILPTEKPESTGLVSHQLQNGKSPGKKIVDNGEYVTKKAMRMRENRADPSTGEEKWEEETTTKGREDEEKGRKMMKILPLSVLWETSGNVYNKSEEVNKDYVVRKEAVYIKHTTLIHERVNSRDKE